MLMRLLRASAVALTLAAATCGTPSDYGPYDHYNHGGAGY